MARHNKKHDARKKLEARRKDPAKHAAAKARPADPEQTAVFTQKIRLFLRMAPLGRMKQQDLANKCRAKRSPAAYAAAMEALLRAGEVREQRDTWTLCDPADCFDATVVRLSAGYGFIRDESGQDHFVPGRYLLGAMPGEQVRARTIPSRREGSPEAEIVSVTAAKDEIRIAGEVIPSDEGLCLRPDCIDVPLRIDYRASLAPYQVGDKVLCLLTSRGERHADHRVKVILNFGDPDNAANCIAARIAEMAIPTVFPQEVQDEADRLAEIGITSFDLEGREDLRGETIFTIDGAHSKDLDDAVSLSRREDGGYTLGVHIADVSHYVRAGSALDAEAFERGTSLYYGDTVIPMLPPALSNGICSLNAGEDRLTVSAIMHLSPQGDLLESRFCKAVICSRVRGVYSECNAILDGTADEALTEKYAPVRETLALLDELTDKLEHLRVLRGAPELETSEITPLVDEEGRCVGLAPVSRGRTERIIEACMLCANEAAARLARESEIPLVYRVHEEPAPERIETLLEMLERLGAEVPQFKKASPRDIQGILDRARDEAYFPVVNTLTLRSMAKARYSEEPLGHFGLALRDYCHFTSPIRRYPDLAVHRILSDLLAGGGRDWLQRRYARFTEHAALQSSEREVRAVTLEREADGCYAAEYMLAHIGEVFQGVITSVTEFGVYVTLENHAEALLHIHDMPEGQYDCEPGWYLRNTDTGDEYRIGMPLAVQIAKAEIVSGHIDAVLPGSVQI